jgi:hypothetical protein
MKKPKITNFKSDYLNLMFFGTFPLIFDILSIPLFHSNNIGLKSNKIIILIVYKLWF